MNTFSNTKSKVNPRNILGGMGFFDETGFEKETSLFSTITSTAKDLLGGVYEAAADLKQTVVIAESKTESTGKFSSGSINFKDQAKQLEQIQKEQDKQKEVNRQTFFFQALKEDQQRAQQAKEKELEDEINDIITNLPTEQKNRLLHYQASYKDRSIYQRAELRKKLIEEKNKAEKQQKEASIPSPAKQPSAMEGAFEGRSGAQGSGTSNLSAQAVG